MNDAVELWSTPWHSLQRRLANESEADKPARPQGSAPASRPVPHATNSWLVRARRGVPRPFVDRTV